MNIIRGTAILLTQLPLILFWGAKFDMLFGFNRMDSGFAVLLFLFVSVPILNTCWLVIEIIRSIKSSVCLKITAKITWPIIALFFLLESIAVDLYIASHAKM
jgi:hypothetical protein